MSGIIKLYSWNKELLCSAEYKNAKQRNKWVAIWEERHPTAYYYEIVPKMNYKAMMKIDLPPKDKKPKERLNFTPDEIKIIRPKAEYSNTSPMGIAGK